MLLPVYNKTLKAVLFLFSSLCASIIPALYISGPWILGLIRQSKLRIMGFYLFLFPSTFIMLRINLVFGNPHFLAHSWEMEWDV